MKVVTRHPLQQLRIVEEGHFAEQQCRLFECLRRYNMGNAEYRELKRHHTPREPIAFPNQQAAMDFVTGRYDACIRALMPTPKPPPQPEPEEISMPRRSKSVGSQTNLDAETVEAIAADVLESLSTKELMAKYKKSKPTIYNVRTGDHALMSEESRTKIRDKFYNGTRTKKFPSQKADPNPMPRIVPETKAEEPTKSVAVPAPRFHHNQQLQVTPESNSMMTLKKILQDHVRSIMADNGITHLSMPLDGEIVLTRKEVLM